MNSNVCLIKTDNYNYPKEKAFRPEENYPEYLFKGDLSKANHIYRMVRDGFHTMGYDTDHWNTDMWNPLGKFIVPGDTVVLKPNLVMDFNQSGEGTDCLYTHPSIVAAVVDYVLIALKGKGKIIIGDAPMQECDFDKLIEESGYQDLYEYYVSKLPDEMLIELVDFRDLKTVNKNGVYHSVIGEQKGKVVNLDNESEFAGESDYFFENMRITNYDPNILKRHHNSKINEYQVSSYILESDVVINLPKPKSHRKAGVTIALKNIVGMNTRKEYLPHHTNGAVKEGGDEYLNVSFIKKWKDKLLDKRNYLVQTKKAYKKVKIMNWLLRLLSLMIKLSSKDKYYEGSWYGNDTISRTIVDLNKILFYADKNGKLRDEIQRKYLIVADMVISGEKEGPVLPSAKNVGMIGLGENPVCFDEMISKMMGIKYKYMHTLHHARNPKGKFILVNKDEKSFLISNDKRWNKKYLEDITEEQMLYFRPSSGWEKAFEKKPN